MLLCLLKAPTDVVNDDMHQCLNWITQDIGPHWAKVPRIITHICLQPHVSAPRLLTLLHFIYRLSTLPTYLHCNIGPHTGNTISRDARGQRNEAEI